MEKHLHFITTCIQVEPEVNDIVRTLEHIRDGKAAAVLLGRKGSLRRVTNANTYTHEQLMAAAREGLLYRVDRRAKAFSPTLDTDTGLPLLMEEYDHAFRKRQLDNRKTVQGELNLAANE